MGEESREGESQRILFRAGGGMVEVEEGKEIGNDIN